MKVEDDNWLTRERVLVLVLAAASALVAWLCWTLVKPFVPAIAWALVLAVLAHPLHERMARRIRFPSLAAALAVVIVVVAIALPASLVVRQVGVQAIASVNIAREFIDAKRWKVVFDRYPRLAPLREWVESEVDMPEKVQEATGEVAKGVRGFLSRAVDISIQALVTVFLLFYFLRDKRRILRALEHLVPLAHSEAEEVRNNVKDTISAVVFGTVAVAIVQGALGGIMFWWLGLPAPLFWGVVMGILAILPMFGAALVWIPAALFLAVNGSVDKALLLTAWGTVIVGLIDNLLYPLLMRGRMRMHTVPVFIAVLGGLFAFGATGVVLGPLILAIAIALIDIWRRRMARGEIETAVNDSTAAVAKRKSRK
ncbi:MAG TPA: AI-2E family transporter [Casimicrobiaceae bacterium]|nr:AI-2E family transporter [Casimicrobiaceae bacterium]